MPFKSYEERQREADQGGRPSNAERERARTLVGTHQVLERLAEAAGRKKPNVPAARLLLQVAGLLVEQVSVEPRGLEALTDQELEAKAENIRSKVLAFRARRQRTGTHE